MELIAKAASSVIGKPRIGGCLIKDQNFRESQIYFTKVDPKKIEFISWFPSSTPLLREKKAYTGICGGAWDYFKSPFRDHFIYRSFSEYLKGTPLHQTIYHKKLLKRRPEKDSMAQVQKLHELSDQLQQYGYRSQYELGERDPKKQIGRWKVPGNEIVVAMGREGKLIRIAGGRHRLAIAQQIDIPEVYAVLTLIHPSAAELLPEKRRPVIGAPEDFMPLN